MADIVARTRCLLLRASTSAAHPAARSELDEAVARLDGPLTVAVAGRVKAGKSTLVNAMLGQDVAPTDEAECTRVVTWYRDGPTYRVEVVGRDGTREHRPFRHGAAALDVDLGRPVGEVERLEVWLPSKRLREQSLVDTPGLASLSTEVSARSIEALADEEEPAVADAVIYLLRHMHSSDVRFLEAFHGSELAHGSPVNAVGVLSRADEVGLCRLDAMTIAERVAGRYRDEPALRRLCPVVLPVAGLLASASSLLREDEYRAVGALATAALDDTIDLLLTAEGFATSPTSVVAADLRGRLLARLGLYGVRLGVQLVRTGLAPSSQALAAELHARSGFAELRKVLQTEFVARSQLLKARSSLAILDNVLAGGGVGDPQGLQRDAEELRSGAHEFEEIRLVHLIRSDGLAARDDQLAELELLLGGAGHDGVRRLGLDADAPEPEVRQAAAEALGRWQRVVEHPLSGVALRSAARAAARSCEAILVADRLDEPLG